MFSITIEGETLDDVTIRVIDVYKALTGRPAPKVVMPAAEAPNAPETDPPKKTRGRKQAVDVPTPAPSALSAAQHAEKFPGGEPIVGDDEEFDRVAAAGIKEAALDKIRAVYSLGAAGVDAVNNLCKDFEVKKLSSVPLEKAQELLDAITVIENKLSA